MFFQFIFIYIDFNFTGYVRLNFQTSGISQKVQNDSAMSAPSTGDDVELPNWKIKMLYDGECPLCMREVYVIIYCKPLFL